jgi:hypothetical protein
MCSKSNFGSHRDDERVEFGVDTRDDSDVEVFIVGGFTGSGDA